MMHLKIVVAGRRDAMQPNPVLQLLCCRSRSPTHARARRGQRRAAVLERVQRGDRGLSGAWRQPRVEGPDAEAVAPGARSVLD